MKLTPKQAARLASVSLSLVYAWCDTGLLTHYRLGGHGKRGRILIDRDDLQNFLESRRVAGVASNLTEGQNHDH